MNRIPIILKGPSGSSKNMAFKLLYQHLTENCKSGIFFRYFPELKMVHYIGHQHSKEDNLQQVITRIVSQQKKYKNYIFTLLIDKIGLAAQSPFHSL